MCYKQYDIGIRWAWKFLMVWHMFDAKASATIIWRQSISCHFILGLLSFLAWCLYSTLRPQDITGVTRSGLTAVSLFKNGGNCQHPGILYGIREPVRDRPYAYSTCTCRSLWWVYMDIQWAYKPFVHNKHARSNSSTCQWTVICRQSSNAHTKFLWSLMTSSNGSRLRVTGPLWGESTGHRWIPLTKGHYHPIGN